jgi:hypothetical protein
LASMLGSHGVGVHPPPTNFKKNDVDQIVVPY